MSDIEHRLPILRKSIFHEEWWLEITARKKWNKVSCETKHGTVCLVYAYRRKILNKVDIYLPPLTPYMGVYFDFDNEIDEITKFKLLDEALPVLIGKLPRYFRFKTNFLPAFDWWSPLYWEGFKQHTRYTSILNNISDHDAIWSGFNNNAKRNVKRAKKSINVRKNYDVDTLYRLFEKTMHNQNRKPGYPKSILSKLCAEIEKRQCGIILTGEDEKGAAHCSLLLVWDSACAYYLVGGTDPELRESGAMSLTMLAAIKEASIHVELFDFEGSMQKGIDRFIRGFGALPVPYYNISDGFLSGKIV